MAKTPGSGRKKGTPNKDKQELLALIRDAVGDQDYHPVVQLALAATNEDVVERYIKLKDGSHIPIEEDKFSPELKLNAAKEVARYVAPQLKAIEHTAGNDVKGLNFIMGLVTEPTVSRPDMLPTNGKGTNGSGDGPAGHNGSGPARSRPRAGQ